MIRTIFVSAAMLALAAPALAQVTSQPTTQPPVTEDMFAKHDTNADGALSIDEVKKADATVAQADFDRYDMDKSKSLSPKEFAKWVEAKTTPPASAPG